MSLISIITDERSLEAEGCIWDREISLLENRFIDGCIYLQLLPNAYVIRWPRSESYDQITLRINVFRLPLLILQVNKNTDRQFRDPK